VLFNAIPPLVVFFIRPEAVQTFLEAVENGEHLLINLLSAIVSLFPRLVQAFNRRVKAALPLFISVTSFGSILDLIEEEYVFCAENP
jgi:hypothetical protein